MLIPATTSAVTKEVYLNRGSMLYVTGTIGATNIGIEVYDGVSAWIPLIKATVTQQLSGTNTYWVCESDGKYRINKPSTGAAAGVRMQG